jgi:UDP-glucose 4-epimerase
MTSLFKKNVANIFITGGAGFIGSHLCDLLIPKGFNITVYDNFSNGKKEFIEHHLGKPNFNLIEADCLDEPKLTESMKNHDLVWHMAANTDLISSHTQPNRDLNDCVLATFNVLESMRKNKITNLLFASSGAVYGKLCLTDFVSETAGPLKPMSPYGAGKIASEAFIHAYCHLYNLRSWMFRFGNVIGLRVSHGILFDFINKLRKDTSVLKVLGDGTQEKNYFLSEECIDGMVWSFNNIQLDDENPCECINLGTNSVSNVISIAKIVIEEMGLVGITKIEIEGNKYAWLGDQPKVHLDTSKINLLGWKASYSSDEAVRIAVKRILNEKN